MITDGFNKKINQIKKEINDTFDPNDITGFKINNKPFEDYIVKIKKARTELGKFSRIKNIESPKINTENIANNIQTPKVNTENIENATKTIEDNVQKIEPIQSRFSKCIDKIKQGFSKIKSERIDIDVEDAELDLLEYKISELEEKLQNAGKLHLSTQEIVETRAKLAKLNSEYDRLIEKEDESSSKGKNAFNSLGNRIEKTMSKIKRFALSLFSIRSIYSLLSRASSAYMSQDTELANKMQAVWVGLGAILEPVISGTVNVLLKGVKYINIFIKALTGVDLLAKATQKSLNGTTKSAKALSKTLAGFDELNNLDTTSDVANTGVGAGWADAYNDVTIDENVAKIIEDFAKKIQENKDIIVGAFIGIATAIGLIKLGKLITDVVNFVKAISPISDFLSKHWQTILGAGVVILGVAEAVSYLLDYLKEPTWENFGGIILGIGIAIIGLGVIIGSIPVIIAGAVVTILGIIAKSWDNIKNFFENSYKWFETKINALPAPIRVVANNVLGIVSGIISIIGNLLDGLFVGVKGILDGIILIFKGDFKNGIIQIGKGIVNILIGIINAFISAINTILSPIRALIVEAGKILGKGWTMSNISIPRIPQLATGTNYVPQDQLAYIHEGEAVIPKKFNSQEYFGGSDDETKSLLQEIREAVKEIEITPYTTVRDVGQASVDYINAKNRRNGRSVFA